MNHHEFKRARRELGLSVREMAEVLGVTPLQVRRMERDPEASGARRVGSRHADRLHALLAAQNQRRRA